MKSKEKKEESMLFKTRVKAYANDRSFGGDDNPDDDPTIQDMLDELEV